MENTQQPRGNDPSGSSMGVSSDAGEGALTREEYFANQAHREEVMLLRREQDRRLRELLETALNGLSVRLGEVETKLNDVHGTCMLRKGTLDAYADFQERVLTRQEEHERRIGELKASYASLKAWVVIVGGITGVAGFLAIVLR